MVRTFQKTKKTTGVLKKLDVSPDMQFYNLLRNFPYDFTRALCEYIDNALQAFIDKKDSIDKDILEITLNFQTEPVKKITISDNGVGISKEDFQKAFKPARRKESPSLSEFGIGMKAASLWFGRKWTLISTPYDENESYFVDFDLDDLLINNNSHVELQKQTYMKESGVIITLSKIEKDLAYDRVLDIWKQLQEIYQLFTHVDKPVLKMTTKYNGQTLERNDEEILKFINPLVLNYHKVEWKNGKYYAIGEKKKWTQNVEFVFNSKKVHGVIFALETSSQKSNPGIRLFRNKRLIQGFFDKTNRPTFLVGTANKHAPSRVMAELHLDGQQVSNNKGEFLIDEREFLALLKSQPGVEELIDQAENFRVREGKINFISQEDFQKLSDKTEKNKGGAKKDGSKKSTIILTCRKSTVDVGTTVSLYDYIQTAEDKNGSEVVFTDIDILVDNQLLGSELFVREAKDYQIEFSYPESNTKTVRAILTITGMKNEVQVKPECKMSLSY